MTAVTKKLLLDIQEAAQSILKHTSSQSLTDFSGDRFFRRAVEREFEIIGEALNRLERSDPETGARITELRRIVDFRNRIIHGYDTIDDIVVWGVAEKHLPLLEREISALLNHEK
ncbi:MAG: HepT-like ribonuclease domain-containing protein [Verrucomicrobiota bacterium]